MEIDWARRLLEKSRAAGIPYFFKQVTAFRSGTGEDALGQRHQEFPAPPYNKWPEQVTPMQPNPAQKYATSPVTHKRSISPTLTANCDLSDREKQAILRLAEAGVNNEVIAKAFGIRPMAVAAY